MYVTSDEITSHSYRQNVLEKKEKYDFAEKHTFLVEDTRVPSEQPTIYLELQFITAMI